MNKRQLLLSALAAVIFAATAAAALAGNVPFIGGPASPAPSKPKTDRVGEAQQSLGVLRRQRNSDDRLPAGVAGALESQGLMGENPDLARKALVTDFGRSYFVVPGAEDVICLVTNDGGALCPPVELALSGQFSGTEACAPKDASRYVQFGMVPDEAAGAVTVTLSDGATRRVPVRDNVYAFTLERGGPKPTQVAWRTPGDELRSIRPYVDTGVDQVACAQQ